MFTITGKQKFGAVWHEGKCLVSFNRGVATTDDPAVADIMRAKGYTVTREAPVIVPLAKMRKADLKAYAAEKGIDLTDVSDKTADIRAAIKAVTINQISEKEHPKHFPVSDALISVISHRSQCR